MQVWKSHMQMFLFACTCSMFYSSILSVLLILLLDYPCLITDHFGVELHLLLSTCLTPNSSEAEPFFVSVGQVQLVFLETMSEPVLTSTKGEIMNRCPIRNGFSDVCHPPGIDLQCYPEDECELLSAAIMCEMSFL